MNPANIKYLWADLIVEELARTGVTMFCISPGSRNSPLVLSAARSPHVSTRIHPDERAAAFFALGYGRARRIPAALISTSGTAVANYFPAIIEASASRVPLIVLTADRPVELRDTASNQTIDQGKIYGDYVRWHFDLPSPTADIPPRVVLTTIDQAAYRSTRSPAGPVHVNCRFREPLTPDVDGSLNPEYVEEIALWRRSGAPLTVYVPSHRSPDDDEFALVAEEISRSESGVLVCGPLRNRQGLASIHAAAEEIELPLFADLASGLRFGKGDKTALIVHYDLFLRDDSFRTRHRPDLILHLGDMPVSAPLNAYIQGAGAGYLLVNDHPFRQDPAHGVSRRIEADPVEFCRRLCDSGIRAGSALYSAFREADAITSTALRERAGSIDRLDEFFVARTLLENLPSGYGLFLGNSMPVRDADACGVRSERDIVVGVNRGASGIDGTIASAAGFSEALDRPVVLLVGDQAFAHDMNSLLFLKRSDRPIICVLVNNNGGGIFSFLPISKSGKHFETHFGAPHDLDFSGIAGSFGLEYRNPKTWDEWLGLCASLRDLDRSTVIEVKTDRRQNVRDHEEVWATVSRAIHERFDSGG